MIETEVMASIEGMDSQVVGAWDRLAVAASLPYSTPAWMGAFWKEYHEPTGDAELRLMVVRDECEIVGIGPFYADRKRPLGLREWWPLAAGIGQRTGPLAAPGREREVAGALACGLRAEGVTILRLPASDALVPWGRWLTEGWPGTWRPRQLTRVVPALTVEVRSDRDFEAWLGARSRNFRSEVSRRTRNLGRLGASIRRVGDPAEVPDVIGSLVCLQRARFSSLGRVSSLTPPTERAVAFAAVALLEQEQRARLWVVETREGIVGVQLHVITGGRMCYYNGGSSPDWAKESLGTVLLATAIRDAHGLGLLTVDLGGGDQSYKRRFADGEAPLEWCSLIPRGLRYPLERGRLVPEDLRRAAKNTVRRLPEAERDRVMALGRRMMPSPR